MKDPEPRGGLFADDWILLHNPRCSKSRKARELLASQGVELRERRYLDEPLTRTELDELRRRLGLPAGRWVRRGEEAFEKAGLDESSTEEQILDAMACHPILIERPILVGRDRAVVGRPPERVLELHAGTTEESEEGGR